MGLTRAQIKSRINSLTKQKSNYISERTKYKKSLSYGNKLLNSLKNSKGYLSSSNDYLRKYFTINGKTADSGKINKTTESLNNIIKNLNNTIIPEINNSINNLNSKINRTDREISNLKRQLDTAEI